ncbi:HipA domain-containing protein [Aquincola sp. S2]|uniref:HipA domain-containing protein n=1 Tax=Pseudaquabacterium terrae TaxID=2732868 RepID=A0ABX2EE34_9BURK|nr:HipA domain-containing protein [Aquabacterium terrae]NRF66876.1 HipA domain-containing protein [Aquabacterium terrae]
MPIDDTDNLLPDNDTIRRRIRARFGVRSTEAFELLSAIGRDCVGAVQLLPVDETPHDIRKVEYQRLSDAEVERILREIVVTPAFGVRDSVSDFRISIAGAQEKTALLWFDGGWCKPLDATPTTHILKLPLGKVTKVDADFSTSVENEWLCAQIVRELGLDVAETAMARFGDQSVLVVERFDRVRVDDARGRRHPYLIRLPQEDMCQATGTPPAHKYENDKGPGMLQCLEVLGSAESPHESRLHFALAQLAFWLLAAPDGHAKNFSVFINAGGSYTHTPLYDVLSAWPVIGKRAHQLPYQEAGLAMAIRSKNAHYKFGEIDVRHWRHLALTTGGEPAWSAMLQMVQQVEPVLARVSARLPRDFPAQVWETISRGTQDHGRKFLRGAAALA